MDFDTSAELFKALSDAGRLKGLRLRAHPPVNCCASPGSGCACDLEEHLGLAQPTVSHHMRLLVQAGLVTATKRGKWTDYTLNPQGFEKATELLQALQASHLPPSTATTKGASL